MPFWEGCNTGAFFSSSIMNGTIAEHLLVKRVIAHKDSDAYAALYDAYVERIYRFIYFKVGNKETAEDVTSDVFLRVWHYLVGQPKNIDSFSGLVYRVARNAIVDVYRKRAKDKEYMSTVDMVEITEVTTDATEKIDQEQNVAQLLQLIKKMKQEYQEVIILRHIDELSISEIARILEKSQTNVRVTLHRAVKKLQQMTEYSDNS